METTVTDGQGEILASQPLSDPKARVVAGEVGGERLRARCSSFLDLTLPGTLSLWGRRGCVRQQEKQQAGAARAGQTVRQG